MLVSNQTIFDSYHTIIGLAELDLPAARAFQFAKFLKSFREEFNTIDTLRAKLILKYGMQDGETVKVDPANSENFERFWLDFSEVLKIDSILPDFQFKLEELTGKTARELEHILWLIED